MRVDNVPDMRVDNVPALGDGQISEVLALVANASHLDGVAPLSEQSLLAVRGGDKAGATTGSPHFLAYAGAHLAGYAHLERGGAGEAVTGEVVVDPAHRRQGVGTALIHALETALGTAPEHAVEHSLETAPEHAVEHAVEHSLETAPKHALETAPEHAPDSEGESEAEAGTLQLWSHGHLDAARAFAVRDGYSSARELWAMRRSLRSDVDPLPDVRLPEGFSARHFVIGQDEEAWLRVNARAFADHPEQGRLTQHDLDRRIAEPWFDARGFILIEDTRGFAPVLAASHWTKVVPAEDPEVGPTAGEVYVVGVDPAYQGLGLGRAVTILGLAHLRGRGLTEATLYVDADNSAAIAVYSRLGFARFAADVMYSHAVHPPVTR